MKIYQNKIQKKIKIIYRQTLKLKILAMIKIRGKCKCNQCYGYVSKRKLASKLSKFVTHGNGQRISNFEYNKDAGIYVCKAGHMAIKKVKQGSKKC